MFSEYASRIMQRSHARMSQNRNRPLFYSTNDDRDDMRENMALRQSRAGIGSRFGDFTYAQHFDNEDEEEDSGHDAMRSSWIPPADRRLGKSSIKEELEAQPFEVSSSVDSAFMESQDQAYNSDPRENADDMDDHNVAPDDIMYGVPLTESMPRPRSPESEIYNEHEDLQDSIQNKISAGTDVPPTPLFTAETNNNSHDRAYATFFIICQAAVFSTSLFVYLTTEAPSATMTDSIYRALTSSMTLIVWDVFIASIVAAIWLGAMKVCIRPMLYIVIFGVPIVSFSLSSYMIQWSYKGSLGGFEAQAKAMRWSGLFMIGFACMWTYTAYTRRFAMMKTVSIVKLSCTILQHNFCLLSIGVGSILVFVLYTFIWLHQFERIFLRGTFAGVNQASRWIMQSNSWLLGAYFVWMFLWTLGVVSGVQRVATSAAVSHWYFHRHDLPKPSQVEVTRAAIVFAISTSFGSICATSLYALMTRIPLVALPRRFSSVLSLAAYWLVSAPILNLTNPLTLSYAAVLSTDIGSAAKSIQRHPILNPGNPWTGYRTAKMLLSAARATTALGLGTAAWIAAARAPNGTASLYGYVVGLMAAAIGWAVVGSIEGMVSMITDASFVCYGIDFNTSREGRSHCLEAVNAFGSGQAYQEGTLQV